MLLLALKGKILYIFLTLFYRKIVLNHSDPELEPTLFQSRNRTAINSYGFTTLLKAESFFRCPKYAKITSFLLLLTNRFWECGEWVAHLLHLHDHRRLLQGQPGPGQRIPGVLGCVFLYISVVDPDPVGDRHQSGGSGSGSAPGGLPIQIRFQFNQIM